ncbi:putative glyoxalase bleomycin resistance protein dioxygenase [Diaporthe ampelina]|uniref:Putative glyoxalase bleomycin resistance protein dioxygenase n=1 Tax=Diaporthe ampelina TaxID=1214573 RepID=A0A0G2HQC4_9PEZI|nr:putative glyoxalase bleomycin resistance protein dioxygenase [Diaporthe ampelina]
MFRKGAALNGAFIQVPEGCLVQAWGSGGSDDGRVTMAALTTFAVESIEGTLSSVEVSGGRVHLQKTAIGGNMGYLARFIDCEGNLQGIWAQN